MHPEVYKQLIVSEKTGPVQPTIKKFLSPSTTIYDRCVNLAIRGSPFNLFNDPDMQEILRLASAYTSEETTILI